MVHIAQNKIEEYHQLILGEKIKTYDDLINVTTVFLESLKPENSEFKDFNLLEDMQNLFRTHPLNDKNEGHFYLLNILSGITYIKQ